MPFEIIDFIILGLVAVVAMPFIFLEARGYFDE